MKDKKRLQEANKAFESWKPSDEKRLAIYLKAFQEQFEKLKDSDRAKYKGLNENDLLTIGSVFERQSELRCMNEAEGNNTFAQLGATPTLAYDFITALFGKSVIPYIASEQVIDEVQGLVYFENILAVTTRGNIEKDNVLGRAAGAPDKYPQGFAGEMVYGEALGVEPNGTLTKFATKLNYKPVRENYVKVIVGTGASKVVLTDDGKGNLIGVGGYGSVNYTTGDIEVNCLTAPEANTAIIANYATNFELGSLPKITTTLDNKMVRANVYGLQTDTSVLSSYMMSKRFQYDMQKRAVDILQEQILNEITNELLMKIEAAVVEFDLDETQFDLTVPAGVSQQAHFNSVDYAFGVIAQKMAKRAGQGTLTVGLAGPNACAFLTQVAKFKRIGEATAYATVYGVYDNTTIIIRCPQLTDPDAIYFLYKGDSPFNAAAVYAPYMPLVGVEDLPVTDALLNRRSAVASMAAIDILVPGYIQKFKLVKVQKVEAPVEAPVEKPGDQGGE